MSNCHICNGELDDFKKYAELYQVTSDCRPWRKGNRMCICLECATVQKPINNQWLHEAEEIYNSYEIYSQADGLEQSTFDSSSGANEARSKSIVSWLNTIDLPHTGKLLDIGCGNGAFLKAFSETYPRYELTGMELDDKNKEEIESINSVKKLYVGNIDTLDDCFDIIVMIHSLEHIPDPVQYLVSLSKKLNQGGLLFIEVPHLEKSPFDILIADHCTHFNLESLEDVVKRSKFKPIKVVSDYIPKELSLLCQWIGRDNNQNVIKKVNHSEKHNLNKCKSFVDANIEWLLEFANEGKKQSNYLGIFGTSISATWLATSLGNKVTFFVDEDENRIGKTHLGKPIYGPNDIQLDGKNILMPFREDIATKICKRYKTLDFITPN